MIAERQTTVAFTGHRTYRREAEALLHETLSMLYARGFRTFLCGMAVGFDMAAAEAVLAMRDTVPRSDVRLMAIIPFEGQQARFSAVDRERFARIVAAADRVVPLAPTYHPGCYAQRNDYLIDHASLLVAWYDGSLGGTRYTVRRALKLGLECINLYQLGGEREQRLF